MKKIVLALMLFFGLESAHAYRVVINPQVVFSPYSAQAQLCNYFPRPVVCNVNLYAQTSNFGAQLFSNLNNSIIYPGQCAFAYLNNYNNWPIINAWATSWCSFFNY